METTANILSRKQVFHIAFQDLKTYDFEVVNFQIKTLGENSGGFLGEHRKLEVNVQLLGNDNNNKRKLVYFLKKIPSAAILRDEFFEKHGSFRKEIGAYKTIFNEFNKVLPDKVFKWRPNLYYSKDNNLFVLEDIFASGYYMCPDRDYLDKEHVLVALKTIAAMHASSLIMEEKLKQGKLKLDSRMLGEDDGFTLLDIYKDFLFEAEAPEIEDHPGHISREVGIRALPQLIDHFPNYSAKQKAVIKKKLPDVLRRIYTLVKPSDKFRNVICHGDLWANNILFRKNTKGKVQDAVLVDFQLIRHCPPAQDVIDFLHLVQSRKFRAKYRSELLTYYYNCLSQMLEVQGLSNKTVLPWHEFLSSCDYYEELGCIVPLFFFQPILTPPELSRIFLSNPELFYKFWQVDRNELVLKCFLEDNIYRERMSEALNELIEKFVLN